MRAASDLRKLHSAVQYRINRIKYRYISVLKGPKENHDLLIAYCVIELDNMAISTLREFTVSCLNRARTLNGHRITINKSFNNEKEISAFILSIINTVKYGKIGAPKLIDRDKEPTVRDPKDIEKILSTCNASNLPSLRTAISLNTGIFRDLATLRNFYAHRNEDTWKKVRNKARDIGVSPIQHPDEIVQATILGRPVSIFEDWLAEAAIFFDELMK